MPLTLLDPTYNAARREAVARAIAATFPGETVEGLTKMAVGQSGAGVYMLAVGGRRALLRLEAPPGGYRDPVRQYACMRLAAEAGVAPRPHHLDADTGLSITDFVEGPPSHAIARAPRNRAIALALRALHAAPLFPPSTDFIDGVSSVWGMAADVGLMPPEQLTRYRARYDAIVAAYPRASEPPVSCHHDLNPTNILFSGDRAFFVDWEVAFASDRYADLATVGHYFCADAAEVDALMAVYFGRPVLPVERSRHDQMLQVVRAFHGLMLLIGSARERPGLRLTAADLDTPPLDTLRSQMATMATWEGRVRFGCAFLTEAYRASL